jgi:hypothetical protein
VLVWLVIAILSTIAVIAVLAALVRHVLLVGRTVRELQEAVTPLVDEIGHAGRRAGERASNVRPPQLGGRSAPPAG